MSGFSTDWLDLREPADHAARAESLLSAACDHLAALERPTVVDLGCGTGSSVRALRPHLIQPVRWRLVDNDPALLRAARARLPADDLTCVEADLTEIDALPLDGADLVTASALFDLVSQDWLERFAASLAERRTGLYAALNYDGRTDFEDPHPADGPILEAFNAHQRGDKGFGPALGPTSPVALETVFGALGLAVEGADSPWCLDPGPLQAQFVEGLAGAVRETGRVSGHEIGIWLLHRSASKGRIWVGHRDILVRPAG